MKLFLSDRTNRLCLPAILCALALVLSSCATTPVMKNDIESRATGRWEAVLSQDWAAAYEYLTPGYRSSVSLSQYERSMMLKQIKWLNAIYNESECTETICKVRITIEFALINVLAGVKYLESSHMIEESWLLVDGNWYLVLEG